MRSKPLIVLIVAVLIATSFSSLAMAETATPEELEKKVELLEKMLKDLSQQLKEMREASAAEQAAVLDNQETIIRLSSQMEDLGDSWVMDSESWVNKFTLGGYGEMHANFAEGNDPDLFDLHRLIVFLGYDFNEWINFNAEFEVEHALITTGSGGEVLVEQAYVDILLSDHANVRVGRILTPIGIISKKHEPPSFNGVERPAFAKYIMPTTWPSDGIGLFGSITPSLKYEAYVVGGLDGTGFSAKNGIRGGRLQERPSLHDPAVTGRLDYYPFAMREAPYRQMLRLGVSGYYGGIDNGNKGSNPDINGDIGIISGDFEYSISDFDFRGAIAFEKIDGAADLGNGTASEIFGWYLEGAYHVMPDSLKKGKLKRSDAVVFVRYDDFDTQYKVPSGLAKNPAGDRDEWTLGVNFYLTPNFVLKADYQIRDDDSSDDLGDLVNLGVGWQF